MDARQIPVTVPNIHMHIEEKRDFNLDPLPWSYPPTAMGGEFRKRLQDSPTIRYDPTELARLAAAVSETHHTKSHVLLVTNGMVVVAEVAAELFRLGDSQSYQIRVYLSRRLAAPDGVQCQGKPRDDWTGTRWQYFLDEKCEIVPWPDLSTLRQLVRVTEPVDPDTDLTSTIEELRNEVRTLLRESTLYTATATEGQTTNSMVSPSYIHYGPESDDEATTPSSGADTNVGAGGSTHKRSISNAGQSDDESRGSKGKRPKQEDRD
jgi:hypothetical protein